jgi:hypothetical protein
MPPGDYLMSTEEEQELACRKSLASRIAEDFFPKKNPNVIINYYHICLDSHMLLRFLAPVLHCCTLSWIFHLVHLPRNCELVIYLSFILIEWECVSHIRGLMCMCS